MENRTPVPGTMLTLERVSLGSEPRVRRSNYPSTQPSVHRHSHLPVPSPPPTLHRQWGVMRRGGSPTPHKPSWKRTSWEMPATRLSEAYPGVRKLLGLSEPADGLQLRLRQHAEPQLLASPLPSACRPPLHSSRRAARDLAGLSRAKLTAEGKRERGKWEGRQESGHPAFPRELSS